MTGCTKFRSELRTVSLSRSGRSRKDGENYKSKLVLSGGDPTPPCFGDLDFDLKGCVLLILSSIVLYIVLFAVFSRDLLFELDLDFLLLLLDFDFELDLEVIWYLEPVLFFDPLDLKLAFDDEIVAIFFWLILELREFVIWRISTVIVLSFGLNDFSFSAERMLGFFRIDFTVEKPLWE